MRILMVDDSRTTALYIGRQNENLATRLVFPTGAWREAYGENGVFALLAQRHGEDSPYPVVIAEDESAVYWDVTNVDTAIAGTGRCELQYYVGDTLAKSQVWPTRVVASIGAAGDAPDPYETWLSTLQTMAAQAQQNARSAQASAEAAVTAQGKAEDAREAAETAQQAAETAKTAAEAALSETTELERSAAQSAEQAASSAAIAQAAVEALGDVAEALAAI